MGAKTALLAFADGDLRPALRPRRARSEPRSNDWSAKSTPATDSANLAQASRS